MTTPTISKLAGVCPPRLARHIALAVILTAAIIIPRSIYIIQRQSPCVDDQYHLQRGVLFLRGDWVRLRLLDLNGPPGGEAIVALPTWLSGIDVPEQKLIPLEQEVPPPPEDCFTLPQYVRVETAVWLSLLFLPVMGVLFHWVATVYSIRAAWLAAAMVLVEPTLAAHMPLPTTDVLGMDGIVIACWAMWRFVNRPTGKRLVLAGVAMGIAMSIKHTALILPLLAVILAMVEWLWHEKLLKKPGELLANIAKFFAAGVVVALTIWIASRCDISIPPIRPLQTTVPGQHLIEQRVLPAGIYLGSILTALAHMADGHQSYLWGTYRLHGIWYYFPVLATYKIPIGIGAIMVLGAGSLRWVRPRYAELPLAICALAWTLSVMAQAIDIGFRHFLPAEIFLIMLAARCVTERLVIAAALAWFALAAAAIDVALWTPDYLSYVNSPKPRIYEQISDSNLDWGQARRQLRAWLDRQPDDGRPVYFAYFGPANVNLFDELGPRLTEYVSIGHWIHRPGELPANLDLMPTPSSIPRHGTLILSALELSGQYDRLDRFAAFRQAALPPDAIIGHCLWVYDLDRLRALGNFPTTNPAGQLPSGR